LTLSFLPHLRIVGTVPLLPIFFIIPLSYFRKGFEPILLAALFGIIFDLFSSYPFGFYLSFFLFLALLVRFMFQEGMRTISFWYFMFLSFLSVAIYYLSQIGFLFFSGSKPTTETLMPVVWGVVVNMVCAILLYIFSEWYFDLINRLEDRFKIR
jgi:rod shape-determining protein MreD